MVIPLEVKGRSDLAIIGVAPVIVNGGKSRRRDVE